ncbi:MAG TPA: hypothetical protein VGD27_03790, partial [Longimicrobiales bacterium]
MAEKHQQPTRNPQQQQMFSNLIASNPKKEGGGAASTFMSAVIHVGLIVLAVYATSRVREVVAESDATNILIPIEEEEPPPPPP